MKGRQQGQQVYLLQAAGQPVLHKLETDCSSSRQQMHLNRKSACLSSLTPAVTGQGHCQK